MEKPMQLTVQISIYNQELGQNLNVNETFSFAHAEFTEICSILGKFHDFAKRIRAEREGRV